MKKSAIWYAVVLLVCGLFFVFLGGQSKDCVDNDGDGYNIRTCGSGEECGPIDCDDSNADVYPGALELCDGIDNQCPGDAGYGDIDEPHDGIACIPTGCFEMGDHFSEGGSVELPVHNVCISAFEMDIHEVTNAEYAQCVDAGACAPPDSNSSYTRPTYYGDPAYDDFPVIYVDWYQATDYCTWAGKRLPTEAEWEYADRGGLSGNRYPWGDAIDCDDACYGRYNSSYECWDHCHNGECDNDTHPVGNYAPNGYGLYDVAGNVWEWTNDWYQSDYYTVSPPNDPPGPTGPLSSRVLRGGGWGYYTYFLRVAYRVNYSPDYADYYVGFRCVR